MQMSRPEITAVQGAIQQRYGALAGCCCSLSCGEALDRAAPRRDEVLVDLGCGRGQDVLRAAGRVGPGGQAIGVDMTEEMLDKARASVPPFLQNVRFVMCDLAALALTDGSADVVISNCTINHAPDKLAVYREIHRVLKPGGRFVVADVIADQELPESVRLDPEAWAACYGGAIPEPDYLDAIRRAGFRQVEVLVKSDPYEKGTVMVRSLTVRGFRDGGDGP
jgi:ubiquinone/menaquinone biosynthesis C-methylase UbiE